MPEKARRIAAIDVGTNSIHMIVAETREHGYRVVDREKEMVQLGLASLDGQPLTAEAMDRGVATIKQMAVISGEEEADYILRAVRSAVEVDGQTALCIDIGGGSVELIVGTADETYLTR